MMDVSWGYGWDIVVFLTHNVIFENANWLVKLHEHLAGYIPGGTIYTWDHDITIWVGPHPKIDNIVHLDAQRLVVRKNQQSIYLLNLLRFVPLYPPYIPMKCSHQILSHAKGPLHSVWRGPPWSHILPLKVDHHVWNQGPLKKDWWFLHVFPRPSILRCGNSNHIFW